MLPLTMKKQTFLNCSATYSNKRCLAEKKMDFLIHAMKDMKYYLESYPQIRCGISMLRLVFAFLLSHIVPSEFRNPVKIAGDG